MLNNCYSFLNHWRVEATPDEVFRIIDDVPRMPQWWPAVVLRVDVLHPGDADGVGRVVEVFSHGRLPYVLRSRTETLEKEFPHRIRSRTQGEVVADTLWTFRADGPFVEVVVELTVRAEKPLIKYLSFALKPLFAWNHYWAMNLGEESLRLEVARRRARTDEERRLIPPPRGPIGLSRRKRLELGLPVRA